MARVIYTPSCGDGPVGPFEREVLETLRKALPHDWRLAPNFQLKQRGRDALEYDVVLLASYALFVIEAKEWYGRLSGDDQEWLLNHTPKRCPMWTVNHKCKVLKTELGALLSQGHVAPVLVVPDGTAVHIGGSWKGSVVNLRNLAAWLQDEHNVPTNRRGGDLTSLFYPMECMLQGKWAARQRQVRRRVGSYEILETLHVSPDEAMYVARRAYVEGDPARYRVRTWRIDPTGSHEEVEQRRAVVRRPTEAISRIGRHPNLLPVLQFDYVDEDHEFFEVTDWSEYGTLHGFLTNTERDRLTIRERLEIAEGVAAALEAVHTAGVIHRNVCPATVLVGFDRKPRLTDFDRAWLDAKRTVFADTEGRANKPYLPPELADVSNYDFDTTSDMYSFGVLLYQLLTDELPFEGPEEAQAAGGCPKRLPSDVRAGVDASIDDLVLDLLRTDDFKLRPTATDALTRLRNVLGMTTGIGRREPSQPPVPTELKVGAVLDGKWRLDEDIGKGTFARVYRVFNLDHQRTYAMKVLVDAENNDLALHEFNQIQPLLPVHPNIVRIVWMDRLGSPLGHPYIVSEFVRGETLEPYCADERRLAWSDIKQIGIELLDALEALHERGVYHRDIKPPNVMLELPSHRPKLIDFNIAAKASEAKGKAGTRRYWAPDVTTFGWGAHADLFSLGVVLYELIVHRHPFPHDRPESGTPYDPRQIMVGGVHLSDELAEFLLKAVQPHATNRFQFASEMKAALVAVPSMLAPVETPSLLTGTFSGIQLEPDEMERQDYNPYVTRMLTLYSQARRTNTGTRGLDDIARLTYVRTGLDDKLAPTITTGVHRLIIVTGNAGDGKTAFLQQVEALFEQNGASMARLPSKNGSTWTWEGRNYETNYDGSQDEESRSNDAVLDAFLKPFEGEDMATLTGPDVRLIAINEGRLLDFLAHGPRADAYGGLRRFVNDALAGGQPPAGALLVNLNLRAVTAGGARSLVEQQLMQLLQPTLWAPCEGCSVRASCPLLHNANTLRDPNSGSAVRERLRRLFEVVHLRRRAHVTMRDLRSALSWLLLRDHGCGDVKEVLARASQVGPAPLVALYYTEAFADPESGAALPVDTAGPERAVDRLVRRLREADVGRVDHPILDRHLDHSVDGGVPWMTFDGRSEVAAAQLRRYAADVPRPSDDVPFATVVDARRQLAAVLRRWAYYERRDNGWRDMLPYTSVALLEAVINASSYEDRNKACVELRDRVVEAVSVAEGVRNPVLRHNYLALRVSRVKTAAIRSYRLFPKERFRIDISRPAHGNFLEFAPDAVELVSVEGPARLRISLDLLEMMELIRHGYRPTAADLQGLFVNLLIFRNELVATTFDRVLLSADDEQFFEVSAERRPEGIRLALIRHGLEAAEQVEGK